MRIKITGSKAHRVWKCPPSAVLPQMEEVDIDRPARNKGKQIHTFFERAQAIGAEEAMAEQPVELHPLLRAIDLDDIPKVACEVAFALNWKTLQARELGRSINREYVDIDWSCEIPITLDLIGTATTRGYVGDFKSGHTKLPAPDRNAQFMIGALCVVSLWGCDDVVLEEIRIHDDGTDHRIRRIVDTWDIDAFGAELQAAMGLTVHWEAELLAGREVGAREGPHCDYCPAFRACPAKIALVRSIPGELTALGVVADKGELSVPGSAVTVAKAAQHWMAIERIEDVLKRIKAEICGMAAFEAIDLPDGRIIGSTSTERRKVDGKVAAELLEKRYGRETRDKYIDLSITLSALQQAVTEKIRPGEKVHTKKGTGVLDVFLADLERNGGLSVKSTEAVRPHVPKK